MGPDVTGFKGGHAPFFAALGVFSSLIGSHTLLFQLCSWDILAGFGIPKRKGVAVGALTVSQTAGYRAEDVPLSPRCPGLLFPL